MLDREDDLIGKSEAARINNWAPRRHSKFTNQTQFDEAITKTLKMEINFFILNATTSFTSQDTQRQPFGGTAKTIARNEETKAFIRN